MMARERRGLAADGGWRLATDTAHEAGELLGLGTITMDHRITFHSEQYFQTKNFKI